MPKTGSGNVLTEAAARDPEEARRVIRRALRDEAGRTRAAARRLGVSWQFFHWWIRRLGLKGEPAAWRALAAERFAPPRGITGREVK